MNDVKSKCLKTTQHIADKILLLRRAKRFSQEKFAGSLNTYYNLDIIIRKKGVLSYVIDFNCCIVNSCVVFCFII